MNIRKIDGMRYVALGEIYHLLTVCAEKASEGTAPGWILDTEEKKEAAMGACTRIMVEISKNDVEYDKCKSADDIKAYHARLRREYLGNKYMITSDDGENEV